MISALISILIGLTAFVTGAVIMDSITKGRRAWRVLQRELHPRDTDHG
jgi:hypothetical protein